MKIKFEGLLEGYVVYFSKKPRGLEVGSLTQEVNERNEVNERSIH